jgi:hypothetical protein
MGISFGFKLFERYSYCECSTMVVARNHGTGFSEVFEVQGKVILSLYFELVILEDGSA